MVIQVVKKDGKIEPFRRIKIVKSCTSVGAPADVAASIADEIEKTARDQILRARSERWFWTDSAR